MSRTRTLANRAMNLPTTQILLRAKQKILAKLKKNKRISTDDIEKILIRHKVAGDLDALQHAHRLNLAQRLMASIRDEEGKREILAVRKGNASEYIAIDFCDDKKQLQSIRHRIHKNISGLEKSAAKTKIRLKFMERFSSRLRGLL